MARKRDETGMKARLMDAAMAAFSRKGLNDLSPLFLRFLQGKIEYDCTPWGMPTYNIFGWQRPCYLLQEGHAASFAELMEKTPWERYGSRSGNPKCADCMVHSGYKASAVDDTFGSIGGFVRTAMATLFPNH